MYARKREKELKKWNPSPTRPQAPFKTTRGMDYTKFVIGALDDIDTGQQNGVLIIIPITSYLFTALSDGNAEFSLSQAEQVMNTVVGLSSQELPNKEDILASLHSCMGNAHIELGNTKLALNHFTMDYKITEKK